MSCPQAVETIFLHHHRAPTLAGMEDDPDYRSLHNTMLLFVAAPIMAYGIIRLLFHLLAS